MLDISLPGGTCRQREDSECSSCHSSAEIQCVKAWVLYRNSNEIEASAVITQQAWNKVIIKWY